MEQPQLTTPGVTDASGIFQVIMHKEYNDISGMPWNRWADRKLICQHDADDEIPRTHCHIMLDGVKVGAEAIKKYIRNSGLGGRGNYGVHTVTQKHKLPYDRDKTAIYLIKGEVGLIKESSYENWVDASGIAQHISWASKWKFPVKQNLKLEDGKLVRESPEEIKPPTKFEILNLVRARVENSADTYAIISEIRKVLVQHKILIGAWKVLDYYDSYMMYERPVAFIEGIVAKINSRGSV